MKRITNAFMNAVLDVNEKHPEYSKKKHEYAVFRKLFDYETERLRLDFADDTEREVYNLLCWRLWQYGSTYDSSEATISLNDYFNDT